MNIKPIYKDLIFYGATIFIVIFLVFRKSPQPVYKVAPTKQIETRIQGKETQIKTFETKVVQDKAFVQEIQSELVELRFALSQMKAKRDTVQIIRYQDTLIGSLSNQNNHLHKIVSNQDSIVNIQRSIITSKDTLIAIARTDVKRVKKQRAASLIINAILAAIIVFK